MQAWRDVRENHRIEYERWFLHDEVRYPLYEI